MLVFLLLTPLNLPHSEQYLPFNPLPDLPNLSFPLPWKGWGDQGLGRLVVLEGPGLGRSIAELITTTLYCSYYLSLLTIIKIHFNSLR